MSSEQKYPDEIKTEANKNPPVITSTLTPTHQGTIANLQPPYDPALSAVINIGGDVYQLDVDLLLTHI